MNEFKLTLTENEYLYLLDNEHVSEFLYEKLLDNPIKTLIFLQEPGNTKRYIEILAKHNNIHILEDFEDAKEDLDYIIIPNDAYIEFATYLLSFLDKERIIKFVGFYSTINPLKVWLSIQASILKEYGIDGISNHDISADIGKMLHLITVAMEHLL